MLDKVRNQFAGMITYGHGYLIVGNDADGDGAVGHLAALCLYRDAYDDELPLAFTVCTWTFIGIGYVM